MDAAGNIYYDENGVPIEDAARLEGYLHARAEQGLIALEAERAAHVAEMEEKIRELEAVRDVA